MKKIATFGIVTFVGGFGLGLGFITGLCVGAIINSNSSVSDEVDDKNEEVTT
jgi:hypothetical protein